MQTSDIERRYRATVPPPLFVSRLSTESPGHDDNLHSHRRRRFIFPFHFAGANFGRAKFHGRISAREISSRGTRWSSAFSRVHPVVTTPRIAPRNPRLSSKNLHVRDRPILAGASGQVSVPDLRNSSCWKVDPPPPGRGRLFTYEDGGGGGRRRQALMPMHHAYSKLRRGTAVRGS